MEKEVRENCHQSLWLQRKFYTFINIAKMKIFFLIALNLGYLGLNVSYWDSFDNQTTLVISNDIFKVVTCS
jgi:hypothetical protein